MSAVPVGYEPLQGLRRKSVSLLCILLASSMAMGILVYVDSFSVHEWNNLVGEVGEVAMSAHGNNIENYVDEIRSLPEVTKAHYIAGSWGVLRPRIGSIDDMDIWGTLVAPDADYFEGFPERFDLIEGRFPENSSEIALDRRVAEQLDVVVNGLVNYSYEPDRPAEPFAMVVVGIFGQVTSDDVYYFWYGSAIAIVTQDRLNPFEDEGMVDIEIDRSPLTPFNAAGSLGYLLNIEQSIRELEPGYSPQYYYGSFWVDDRLSQAVSMYINWQSSMRYSQLLRAGGVIVLVVLVLFLAIRHNMNEKRYENNMLMSRGASVGDIERRMLKEIVGLSAIGAITGLALGLLFSRFGLASEGYFVFSPDKFFTEPFLISLDSLVIAVIVGFFLPVFTWFGYNAVFSTKRRIEESEGKLQKLSRVLIFIKWDIVLLVLSILFLVAVSGLGPILQYSYFFSMIAGYIPLALFIAIGSLSIKVLRRGAIHISRGMNKVIGVLPSSVGVRRIGKSASSAGPAILVLVLSMSIAWTYAIIGASMPTTKLNQARFTFGGDASFHLGSYPTPLWDDFRANVSEHELCLASSMVSISEIRLSSDYWDYAFVMAIDPEEYQYVGYDYRGVQLNESELAPLLQALISTPSGTIISRDIADSYNLGVGDSLRGFSFDWEGAEEIFVFTVVGISEVLSNAIYRDTGTDSPYFYTPYFEVMGSNTIWVNRNYFGSIINLANSTHNVLCVRTPEGSNSTQLVEDVLNQGGSLLITEWDWTSASYEVDYFTQKTSYKIDRAVDTMLTIASSVVIFAAFSIYAFEGATARKREIALIRSMGGDRSVVIKAQIAEMVVLVGAGLVLLAGYAPLYISNTLMTYKTSYYTYPIPVYPIYPLITMISVLLFFVVSVIVFIAVVAALTTRINIAESLNASWAESGPYGGDM
ncbi:MAG: FtsX-like permease family protein [Candidatus Thorarchaeota archaeon]